MPLQYAVSLRTTADPPAESPAIPCELEAFHALRRWIQTGRILGTVGGPYECHAEISADDAAEFVDAVIAPVLGADHAATHALRAWIAAQGNAARFVLSGGTY